MDLKISGKRALVTGSTAGIGFSIANLLAREGAFVYVNGRTEERVKKAVAELEGKVDGVAADRPIHRAGRGKALRPRGEARHSGEQPRDL